MAKEIQTGNRPVAQAAALQTSPLESLSTAEAGKTSLLTGLRFQPDRGVQRLKGEDYEKLIKTPGASRKAIEEFSEIARRISRKHNVHPVPAWILAVRGFRPGAALQQFLNPSLDSLPDPLTLKNVEASCQLITRAVLKRKKIAIVGDFDVDGVASVALLTKGLRSIGARVSFFTPDRFADGYGLPERLIKRISSKGYDLLIAADMGTTAQKELEYAKELGLKTIVLDHHHIDINNKPVPGVFINPEQKGCNFANATLCAGGLSYFQLAALKKYLAAQKNPRVSKLSRLIDLDEAIGFAALATIADMSRLNGANRVLVAKGLQELSYSKNVGVQALKEFAGIMDVVSAQDVGYKLGPMINAMGRLGKEADLDRPGAYFAMRLLTTGNRGIARKLAQRLYDHNELRKEVEHSVVAAVEKRLSEGLDARYAVACGSKEFHQGVIGLAASRLVERTGKPAAIYTYCQDGICRGSIRTVPGAHGAEILQELKAKNIIRGGGGHEMAGGFSMDPEKAEQFEKAFSAEVAKCLKKKPYIRTVSPDLEIDLSFFNETELGRYLKSLGNEINRVLEPTGVANPPVQILAKGAKVLTVDLIKNAHLRAVFQFGGFYIPGFLWHHGFHPAIVEAQPDGPPARRKQLEPQKDSPVDIVFKTNIDEGVPFNPDDTTVSIQVVAARKALP